MTGWIDKLKRWHPFFVEQGLYPILLSTLLIVPLYAYPIYVFGYRYLPYRPLIWNFFLAAVPYPCALLAAFLHQRFPGKWAYLIAPSMMWLTFFPNAPYLVTDIVHFRIYFRLQMWHEVISLTALVWTGLFIAIYSLRTAQAIVKDYTNLVSSWIFVMVILLLNAVGVYLGRFLRWNSWDLITEPMKIGTDIYHLITGSTRNLTSLAFIIQMALFMLVCYITLALPQISGQTPSE